MSLFFKSEIACLCLNSRSHLLSFQLKYCPEFFLFHFQNLLSLTKLTILLCQEQSCEAEKKNLVIDYRS